MALSCDPDLLIADEPTTALDVTVQAQVMDLLEGLQRSRGMALMLISHDLAVVARACARLRVMYAGRTVEEGPTAALLAAPRHPYTAGLIQSDGGAAPRERLVEIPGQVPDPRHPPAGCRFHDRCPLATDLCRAREPELLGRDDRLWRCHTPLEAP